MKVLIGTTNPAKVTRFEEFLPDSGVEFLTLKDLGITAEPEETGKSPEENARIKAAFYGQFCDRVICNDSGLYFDGIPMDDPRQPGLNIRSPKGQRLNDEEMIAYYSELVTELGGKVLAYYLDGVAVYRNGSIMSYLDEQGKASAFYMVNRPSCDRHPGWPLDSISLYRNSLRYFTDHSHSTNEDDQDPILVGDYRHRVTDFLKQALGLEINL